VAVLEQCVVAGGLEWCRAVATTRIAEMPFATGCDFNKARLHCVGMPTEPLRARACELGQLGST